MTSMLTSPGPLDTHSMGTLEPRAKNPMEGSILDPKD